MNNKNALLFLSIMGGIIVLLLISRQFGDSNEATLTDKPNTETTVVKPVAKTPTYAEALTIYKDKRIQLDPTCQASPNNLTFKNNTKIMIDNRSAMTRTVKVGNTMSIPPWGFKIVTLYSAQLPVTWYVDCATSQNVASILIQK